jgi:hypothetical protein
VHEHVEEEADHHRREVPDPKPLEPPRLGVQLGQRRPGEGQVPRLLLTVVAVYRRQQRIGVGMLRRQLLKQVRDLLAREYEHEQERRHLDEAPNVELQESLHHAARHRVHGLRVQLLDQADERALMAGLLGDLVEHVADARVADVLALGNSKRKAGVEHGFEADPHFQHRRDLLAREARLGLRREVEVEAGGRQQLVADHLALTERVPVEELFGLEHLADRGGREAGDPLVGRDRGRGRRHAPSLARLN